LARLVRWTVEELERIPDDGKLREIIDGDLYVSTQPHTYHQLTSNGIMSQLDGWNDRGDYGFVIPAPGVVFSSDVAVAPDVIWISQQRLSSGLDAAGHLRVAPELVVEILSPGAENERRDREIKLGLYSRIGVNEYWIADWRQRQVHVYRRSTAGLVFIGTLAGDDEIESPYLQGFRCRVTRFFAYVPTK
jgi:Uma2 family endonuclease